MTTTSAPTVHALIVEDSPVIRDYLRHILEGDPRIRVIGVAETGEAALECVRLRLPDVILMDVHLPGIDGFETTRRIMSTTPTPIVICSATTDAREVGLVMRAMEAGALAALKKPAGPGEPSAETEAAAIVSTIKLMSEVKVVRRWNGSCGRRDRGAPQDPASAAVSGPADGTPAPSVWNGAEVAVVAIGASTGGPPVIQKILSGLTPAFPAPLLVVQHITAGFTAGFVEWLAAATGMPVRLAAEGTTPQPGHVYVAPDDRHLLIGPFGELRLSEGDPHCGLRPSVGVLFRSAAERFGRRAVGVLLTGMGRDGAEELKGMADRGALTIAQDEASCAVFGMPAAAIELGAARCVLPPGRIAELLAAVTKRARD